MEKYEIVRYLRLANDLWAIQGANPYSIRAHDKAAEAILSSAIPISEILVLPPGTVPGVGRETLNMVRALLTGGFQALLEHLNIDIPVSAAELIHLPGIGPKTANLLVHQLGICDAESLHAALTNGQLQQVPGLGPGRLARLRRDLQVLLEGRSSLTIAQAWPFAQHLAKTLEQLPGVKHASVTGAFRRLVVISPRVELIVSIHDPEALLAWLRQFDSDLPSITNDSTVDLKIPTHRGHIPVLLHVTPPGNYPVRLMETTGDETHHAVVTGLLQQKHITWTTSGLLNARNRIEIKDEKDIYSLLGLPYLPPEIREGQGLLCQPSKLISEGDIKGDLHVHSNWSDGALPIHDLVQAAEQRGYEYIAITDHSQSLSIAHGLTPERLLEQRNLIAQEQKHTKVKILHGIEVDILSDGRLDLPDETLLQLDLVIASIHSAMHQNKEQMTKRILQAIRHPSVHILGHLTGRLLGRRAPYELNMDELFAEAANHGVMFELNANPNRLDISDEWLRKAKAQGMLIPINTDTHDLAEFENLQYGIRMARRGWLYKQNVLNALPYEQLHAILRSRRR